MRPSPAQPSPSVRSLARHTGFSKATVANALRGDSCVAPATAAQILAAARSQGYRHNPIVSTVMSAMRRAQSTGFHGVIACLDLVEPERPEHGPFHRELVLGARARAADMGFGLEEYSVGPRRLSLARLEAILTARGISGVLLLPSWKPWDLEALDWTRFCAVSADRLEQQPQQFHAVCCDHYNSVLTLLEQLHARGYRAPGLILDPGRDERVMLRLSAALRSFQLLHPRVRSLPLLCTEAPGGQRLGRWFRRHRPDVVLSHHDAIADGLARLGVEIPAHCGFVCLNLAKTRRPCAGLDLQPRLIGGRSIESLVGLLQRNERGIPENASTLTLTARLREGPTLRGCPGKPLHPRS